MYPQDAFPYEQLLDENRAPLEARPRVRAARHGDLRRRPLLGDHRRLRQGLTRGPPASPQRAQRRDRRPRRSTCSPRLWFRNTWSWDLGAPKPSIVLGERRPRRAAPGARHPLPRRQRLAAKRSSATTRRTPRGSSASDDSPPYPKDGINDHVVAGRRHRQPRADRHEGGVPLPPRGRRGRDGRHRAATQPTTTPASAAISRRCSPTASAKPTSSTRS